MSAGPEQSGCHNKAIFPILSVAAQRYLATPETSVPSSSMGDICCDNITCLLAETTECKLSVDSIVICDFDNNKLEQTHHTK